MYDGGWKDKAADGYGVMKWQNGDRLEMEAIPKKPWIEQNGDQLGWIEVSSLLDLLTQLACQV